MQLDSSSSFFNRELSWIEFNARVLSEAFLPTVPLLERLKFIAIASANFDEFFMVRVASLKRMIRQGLSSGCPTGMSAREQLEKVRARVVELTQLKYRLLHEQIIPELADQGIRLLTPPQWSAAQRAHLHAFFVNELFPILTPVRAEIGKPLPYVGNLRLHAAFLLTVETVEAEAPLLALVQVPPSLPRIITLPGSPGSVPLVFIDHVIGEFAAELFPGHTIIEQCIFRVTRDADFGVDEERDEDFIAAMEQVLEYRERSVAVRLTINREDGLLPQILTHGLDLSDIDVYRKPDPLELRHLMELAAMEGFDHLRDERRTPVQSPSIAADQPIWDSIRHRDVLLSHPYESFEPVIRLLQEAAEDRDVLAIKMTLYRTSGDSPVVRALEVAALAGKQVAVVVEVKARFDEERNIEWANRLERAGAIVVYGVARLKVHAKALLIVRREADGVRRYVHMGTGNYNEKTARLYTDMALLTTNEAIATELSLVFNAITGYSIIPRLERLRLAPVGLKVHLLELIAREADRARSAGSGLIMAKLNALADAEIIEALYRAAQHGVTVLLNIRGICMLVPGVAGLSENIRVVSVVDRYLEHTRMVCFANGGAEELYLSSADWMPRNLDRRIELLFPIEDPDLHARAKRALELFFEDTVKAHELQPDGRWVRCTGRRVVRAQDTQYQWAVERVDPSFPENRQEFAVRNVSPRASRQR